VTTRQLESYKGIQIYAAYNPTPSLLHDDYVLMALYKKGATLLTTNYDDLSDKACGLPRIGRINRDDTLNTNVEYALNALFSN